MLMPSDAGYEDARRVYNGMIDKRPGAIARCMNVADVIAAVRAAREQDVLTAVRGGGHNAGGLGICNDGLVIDLSRMKGYEWIPPRALCAWKGAAYGLMWITPRTPLAWPLRAERLAARASPASRWAAASAT